MQSEHEDLNLGVQKLLSRQRLGSLNFQKETGIHSQDVTPILTAAPMDEFVNDTVVG